MRFYLDENLPRIIAEAARRLGLDVTCTEEYARKGASDVEQLRFAAQLGRCIVTRDQRDFREHTDELLRSGGAHSGVLFVPNSIKENDIGGIVRGLAAYAEMYPGDPPPYLVDYLPHVRR